MRFGGFDWDSGNLPKCLGRGVSVKEIEALFAGDVYIVRDAIVAGERRALGFGEASGRWIFSRVHLTRGGEGLSGSECCADKTQTRPRI